MPEKVTAYDLLISCPSDVADFVPSIEKPFIVLTQSMEKRLKS